MANPKRPPFGGFYHPASTEEDAELTHVGPGTPGGNYLRRYWHPIALVSELKDMPMPIRVLGEDLVLFRAKSGKLGLVHRACSHRGTSLEYGIISENGIRCAYHGWHYGLDGTVLETPSEPPGSRLRESLCHGAYRTHEHAGLIFTYMGPPDETPEFPIYDTLVWPQPNTLVPYKLDMPCNWLQVHENAADPIHTAYLHSIVTGVQFTPAFSALPVLEFIETPLGLLSVATRRCGENIWVRASDAILPNVAQFGTGFVDGHTARDDQVDGFELADVDRARAAPRALDRARLPRVVGEVVGIEEEERIGLGESRHRHVDDFAVLQRARAHGPLRRVGVRLHRARAEPLVGLGERACCRFGADEVGDAVGRLREARHAGLVERDPHLLAQDRLGRQQLGITAGVGVVARDHSVRHQVSAIS